jgi:ketosteroid isomerase-like protein
VIGAQDDVGTEMEGGSAMVRDQIEANNARFALALERGDAAAAAPANTDDAQLLAANAAPIRGREEVEAIWKGGIQMGIRATSLETLEVEKRVDVAYEVGRYALLIQPDDSESTTEVGNDVVIHRRQPNGSWNWAVDIFNSDAPST